MWCAISCSIKEEYGANGNFLYEDYAAFFEKRGINLVLIPNETANAEAYFEKFSLEGVVLSGGNDIGAEPVRDSQEKTLMDIAIKRGLPVFGICRGMQFINYYFGKNKPLGVASHVVPSHGIKILDEELKKALGKAVVKTNSFHKQGYAKNGIAGELEIIALCEEDGVVEALRHKRYPIAGIQWHPERKSPDEDINDMLVESFKERKGYWA